MMKGIHIFAGRGGVTPKRAKQLAAHGVRRVVLCSEAVDGWTATDDQAKRWGDACGSAGLSTSVYTFPGVKRTGAPIGIARLACRIATHARANVVMADVEAPYHGRASRLVGLLDALYKECDQLLHQDALCVDVAVTTLGLPTAPGRFPWPELLAWLQAHPEVLLAWQCYERASRAPGDSQSAADGLAMLRARLGQRVFPCVASYSRRTATKEVVDGAARLLADLERASSPDAFVWSAASLDDAELRVLQAWALRRA